jgi:nanoRNase/pAp phosphatase (c-di-AMP/oligoRNAs hydrolase)
VIGHDCSVDSLSPTQLIVCLHDTQSSAVVKYIVSFGHLIDFIVIDAHLLVLSNSPMNEKIPVQILYHCPCPDGAYALLAAYWRFHNDPQFEPCYVPHMTYKSLDWKQDATIFTKKSIVYLLDYIGPQTFITDLAPIVNKIVVLDHHKTGMELINKLKEAHKLPENIEVVYDMNRSGATIAYDYFNQEKELIIDSDLKKKVERFYAYIEDNDLWRKCLPNATEFASGLRKRGINFDWTKNSLLFEQLQYFDVDAIIAEGRQTLRDEQHILDHELQTAFKIQLRGEGNIHCGYCLAVVTQHPELRSALGNKLAHVSFNMGLRGIGAVVYVVKATNDDTKYKVSLRSVQNEDTTPIATAHGGGGHKNASSFVVPIQEFESLWIVESTQ